MKNITWIIKCMQSTFRCLGFHCSHKAHHAIIWILRCPMLFPTVFSSNGLFFSLNALCAVHVWRRAYLNEIWIIHLKENETRTISFTIETLCSSSSIHHRSSHCNFNFVANGTLPMIKRSDKFVYFQCHITTPMNTFRVHFLSLFFIFIFISRTDL